MIIGRAMEQMCRAVVRRLDEYLDGELNPLEMSLIRMHLHLCERCGPRYQFEKALLASIRRKSASLTAPQKLGERINQAIGEYSHQRNR
ncbi:MAG: zf-HC2 domain-containing protein [Chloroflexi bacterium]|nr:zf-HC2 domain-containing protein [Chloroflexota bacterium]